MNKYMKIFNCLWIGVKMRKNCDLEYFFILVFEVSDNKFKKSVLLKNYSL